MSTDLLPRPMINLRRHALWLMAAALLMIAPGARAGEAATNADRARTPLVVVLDDNYPPYIFRDDQGRLQGILKDTWALWSERTGTPVDLQAMDWERAQQRILTGKADVIDTLFFTPERQKIYDYSAPYADIEVGIFFRNTISGIVDADSLKGFTVGVKAGDACINTLNQHGITTLKPYPSYQALIKAAAANEVVVFCIDKPPAMFLLYKMGLAQEFKQSKPLYTGQFHWAVRSNQPALKRKITEGFSRISHAERRQIEEKWMGSALYHEKNPLSLRIVLEAMIGILLLITVLALWNISLRRRVAAKTAEQAATLRYLSATLSALPDLLFEMDIHGTYHDYRASQPQLLAAPPEALLQHNVSEVMPPEAADACMAAIRYADVHGTSHGTLIKLPLPDGECWFELSVAKKQVDPGMPGRFIVISRDITKRKDAEAEIEQLAFFDPLTGLPNRRTFQDRLRQVVADCRQHQQIAALLFIDIDNFKMLNDTRGHRIGDALLQSITVHMQSSLRADDCLARFGGDEFVVILAPLSPELQRAASETESVAEKLLDSIRRPCLLDGSEYHPTASIGICLFSAQDAEHEDEVLKRADMAMYRAKSNGRNAFCFFDPAMQAMQESRVRLDQELRAAVAQEQFELFYQPQVSQDRGIIGAEALLRWRHPQRGLVQPAQFIGQAEESGLILPIGQWVIDQACQQLQRWQTRPYMADLCLSVNVSTRQFQQPDFVHQVHQALLKHHVVAGRLKFELTENLVLANAAEAIEKMHLLQSIGIRLSLDDFGTGYASLSYLKRLPINEIKIDRTFMRNITTDHGNSVIVRTIISMARNFGLDVIAEGVEHLAQRDYLFENGCHQFQGYLVSRPVPESEFEALLRP